MNPSARFTHIFSTLTLLLTPFAAAAPADILLPTLNNNIFHGEAEKFYMYVQRNFEGKNSRPWTAGKYGFVRSLKRTEDGVIGTRFHEGIDIRPIERDSSGKPKDEIRAIAAGTIVYTNTNSRRSNYGKYIVIVHPWDTGPMYSLYAHLSEIEVKTGQSIAHGQTIGKMGYTGAGINRERAHLHLEFNLQLSNRFSEWHNAHFNENNIHGNSNGINMAGIDIAAFYIARQQNKSLTVPEFIKTTPLYYKVTVPRNSPLEIVSRYPWLARGDHKTLSPSWEISFSASGLPLSVSPSHRAVTEPRISSVLKCRSKHHYHTKGMLTGTGHQATLSKRGKRFISLVTGNF